MTEISYTTDGVEMPSFDTQRIENWIVSVARGFGKTVGAVTYIFCNDDKILEVNRKYINHDYYTDIITFDYSRPMRISGDVFISLDTVRHIAWQNLRQRAYESDYSRYIAPLRGRRQRSWRTRNYGTTRGRGTCLAQQYVIFYEVRLRCNSDRCRPCRL